MKALLYTYYMLMLISFSISFFRRNDARIIMAIFWLLLFSVLTEATVEILKAQGKGFYFVYHLFTPLEFLCIALFFLAGSNNKTFTLYIKISIALFLTLCIMMIYINYKLHLFPDLLSYVESFLIITFCVIFLLLIEPAEERSILYLPEFWITLGFLIYSSGIFFPLLFHSYSKGMVEHVFQLISKISNCILYLFLTIGLLCLRKTPKL